MKLENTTAIPDYVESMGFDNALREIALYAEICANSGGNDASKRVFYRVMAAIASCADDVEALLVNPESINVAMEQFQKAKDYNPSSLLYD